MKKVIFNFLLIFIFLYLLFSISLKIWDIITFKIPNQKSVIQIWNESTITDFLTFLEKIFEFNVYNINQFYNDEIKLPQKIYIKIWQPIMLDYLIYNLKNWKTFYYRKKLDSGFIEDYKIYKDWKLTKISRLEFKDLFQHKYKIIIKTDKYKINVSNENLIESWYLKEILKKIKEVYEIK